MSDTKEVKSARRKPPNAGKGRKKGSRNKTTSLLKDAILKAAEEAGDAAPDGGGLVAYLKEQAEKNPTAFVSLLGKVLPLQVTGDGGGPVKFQKIERVVVDSKD